MVPVFTYHPRHAYGGLAIKVSALITSGLDVCEGLASCSGRFTSGGRTPCAHWKV